MPTGMRRGAIGKDVLLNSEDQEMEQIGKSLTNLVQSSQRLTEQSQDYVSKAEEISTLLRTMVGCFRSEGAVDPEIFFTAAIATLMRYPVEVARLALDPVDGIPGRLNWVPTISELKTECEKWHYPIRAREAREASIRQQLAERSEHEYQRPEPLKERDRGKMYTHREFDQAVKKHGRPFGVFELGRITPYGR